MNNYLMKSTKNGVKVQVLTEETKNELLKIKDDEKRNRR